MQKRVHSAAAADSAGTDANVLKLEQEGGVGIQVSGAGTWTLTPEATLENPNEADATWIAIQVYNLTTGLNVSTLTADAIAYVDLPGFGGFRLRQTAGSGLPTSWINEAVSAV